jgi:two-component system NtrC family response regulator
MRRILAVDEEWTLIDLYRKLLEGEGFEVVGAHGEQQALDLLQRGKGRFVLVILDIEMYRGRRLLERIHRDYPHIPILNCSLNDGEGRRLIQEGICVASVPKPFSIEEFIDGVRQAVRLENERRSGKDRRRDSAEPDFNPSLDRRREERRRPLPQTQGT